MASAHRGGGHRNRGASGIARISLSGGRHPTIWMGGQEGMTDARRASCVAHRIGINAAHSFCTLPRVYIAACAKATDNQGTSAAAAVRAGAYQQNWRDWLPVARCGWLRCFVRRQKQRHHL